MVSNWLINTVLDDLREIERRRQRIARIGAIDPKIVHTALTRHGRNELIAEGATTSAPDRRDDNVDRLVSELTDDHRRVAAGG